MNTEEENRIDQMLKALKPVSAPVGFEQKVMDQIAGMVPETNIPLLSRLHFYLLLVSLGAVAVAAFYLVGIDKIQLLFSTYHIIVSGWLHTGVHIFVPIMNTFSHIPVLVFLIGAILAVLLILERILLRKSGQSSFIFLY